MNPLIEQEVARRNKMLDKVVKVVWCDDTTSIGILEFATHATAGIQTFKGGQLNGPVKSVELDNTERPIGFGMVGGTHD